MVTVKITEDARRMFRILAAHYGTTIHEEVASAAWRSILNAGLQTEYKKAERRSKPLHRRRTVSGTRKDGRK